MRFCTSHHFAIVRACARRGMGHLVYDDHRRLTRFLMAWGAGNAPLEDFHAPGLVGIELRSKAAQMRLPVGAHDCPLCRAAQLSGRPTVPLDWIAMASSAICDVARRNGLVKGDGREF